MELSKSCPLPTKTASMNGESETQHWVIKRSRQDEHKPGQNRRNTMKSSKRDNAEGKMHQVKGKVKETVGRVVKDRDLEAEGIVENIGGKAQEKIGEIKKVAGK